MSQHRGDFKGGRGAVSADDQRKARHQQTNCFPSLCFKASLSALRKQHREKSFAVKRAQFDLIDEEDEHASVEIVCPLLFHSLSYQIASLVEQLKHGSQATDALRRLKSILFFGSLQVDLFLAFVGVDCCLLLF
jgi:hypothetical protein